MTINTKMRLSILASAFALVVAAPAAFAQGSGTWNKNVHTDPVTAEGITTRHSKELMERKSAAPAASAQDSGRWYGDMHTDPITAEGIITRHSRKLMEQETVPGNPTEKLIKLNDGSTVRIFADGKMAMQSQFGRVTRMEPGQVMQTVNGSTIIMNGDEVGRLQQLLNKDITG